MTTDVEGEMALQFSRVETGDLEIWIASSDDYSFVISNESRGGLGLHGEPGFVASYRPDFQTFRLSEYARASSVRIALQHAR